MQQIFKGAQQDKTYFCYLSIRQLSEAVACIIFIAIVTLLLLKALHQLRASRLRHLLTPTVRLVYFAIFAWAAFSLAELILCECTFWLAFYTTDDQELHYYTYSILSKYILIITYIVDYLVQTVLILVAYNWAHNLIEVFRQLYEEGVIGQADLDGHLGIEKCSKKTLHCYLVIRLLFVLLVLPFALFSDPRLQGINVRIMLIVLILESVSVLILLIVLLVSLNRNLKLQQLLEEEQIGKMQTKYKSLIACIAVKLLIDLIFTVFNYSILTNQKRCFIGISSQLNAALHFINLFIGGMFTQCMPIYIILRMYAIDSIHNQNQSSTIQSHLLDTASKDKSQQLSYKYSKDQQTVLSTSNHDISNYKYQQHQF